MVHSIIMGVYLGEPDVLNKPCGNLGACLTHRFTLKGCILQGSVISCVEPLGHIELDSN